MDAAGRVATVEAAAMGTAVLVEAAALVEVATGQDATMEEAMGLELVWWRRWRRLETAGRRRCWQHCCSYASGWQCALEVLLELGGS